LASFGSGGNMAAGEPRAVRQMAFPQVEIEAEAMIEKTVNKLTLSESGSAKRDLAFWLSKPAEERVAAVDFLRRQYHGSRTRLQKSARVIRQASS
jgi:hypothetical protein